MIQRQVSTLFAAFLLLAMPLTLAADEPLWIDVRTAQEFSEGHVTQASNIPYEEIGAHIGGLAPDKNALIYLYCRSGRRAGVAAETLEEMGYTQVFNVGGLDSALKEAALEEARQSDCRLASASQGSVTGPLEDRQCSAGTGVTERP